MRRSSIKKIGYFFIVLIISYLALFPREALLKCVGWKTKRYCEQAFGARLVYDSLTWEEDKIVFKNGRLHKKGELDANFSKAVLLPFFNLKERKFGGELCLEKLKIVHQKKELRPVPHPPSPSFKLFTLQLDTQIKEGEIFLYDYLSEKNFFQHAFFDVTHHVFAGKTRGEIAFCVDPSLPKLLTQFYHEQGNHLQLSVSFKSQPLTLLSHLVAYFFQNYLPDPVFKWDVVQGEVNGDLEMKLVEGVPLKIKGNIAFDGVQGENLPLKLLVEMEHLGCDLDIDLSDISSIHGFLDLKDGRIALKEPGSIWEGLCDLNHIDSHICIKEGKIERSALKGHFMGMEGEMVLDWQAHDILMSMGFHGTSQNIGSYFSGKWKECFDFAFPQDFFALEANLKRSIDGLKLEGQLKIAEEKGPGYGLAFGCYLGANESQVTHVLPEKFDYSLSGSVASFLDSLKQQFCLSQKRLGWFRAENFPLEKFASPFLLNGIQMELRGNATLKGTFDDHYLVVFYEGKNFELECPQFLFHLDEVKERLDWGISAVHYFDLKTWDHVGFLPVHKGHYWQKKQNFHLENTQAIIQFENREIRIQNIATCGEGLDFKGNVSIDIHSMEDVDLKIQGSELKGPASSAQKFLTHFRSSFLWQIPLEGSVEGSVDPLFFHYHFTPHAQLIEGRIAGHVNLSASSSTCSLREYRASLSYDCNKNSLEIKQGTGTLLLPKKEEPLVIQTPWIHLTHFPDALFDFSCTLLERDQPYVTLYGNALKQGEEKKIHLWGERNGKKIECNALQKGTAFAIHDYTYGEWSGEGEMALEKGSLNILDLACQSLEKGGLNLRGTYNFREKTLSGEIRRITCDLSSLSPLFGMGFNPWNPEGKVEGRGEFRWTADTKLEVEVGLSFHDLGFGGIHFGSGQDLRCLYASKGGFSVEGLEIELPRENTVEKYKLGRFHYNIHKQKALFEGFDFCLPPDKLPWVAKVANELFPGKIGPLMMDWVEALKKNEPLEGRVSLEVDPSNLCVHLNLKDGIYFCGDRKFDLKKFYLIYDQKKMQFCTLMRFRDSDYTLHVDATNSEMDEGIISLSDPRNAQDALVAGWKREEGKGFRIKEIRGFFSGLEVDLVKKQESDHLIGPMEGYIGFDPQKMLPLLSEAWKKKLETLALSGKYYLEGEFVLNGFDLSHNHFSGQVYGRGCKIKGVEVETVSAMVHYVSPLLKFEQIVLKDWAGRLFANQLTVTQKDTQWNVSLDYARLSDLRFSRLKSPWTRWVPGEKPFFRHLYIPSFVLANASGTLEDLQSFAGSGNVEFTNLPKKNLLSNLLFLPTEITARIGLDLSVLVPVRGKIDYSIREGKIIFDDLEMYSDGKRSRFYLAEGSDAFMDFSGNLNMKVKMKQYSLLMKLAEFFTINVKGSVLKPSYTLRNHRENADTL